MSSTTLTQPRRALNALEKNLLGVPIDQIPTLLPGLLLTSMLAWLSIWLSEYLGVTVMGFAKSPISAVMMAIVLGLIVGNALPLPVWLRPGFKFAVSKLLRLGIILLGIRLSIFDVFKLGALGLPIVLLCIGSALFFTTRLNKWLKLPERLATLIAVGTSICGVSAIVATGPAIDAKDEEVAYAVAVITIFGIIATLAYPYLAYVIFAGDPVRAGLFLGTSIHDTSQVTGAAMLFADVFDLPRGLDVATVTKLVRNVFMALINPLMALHYYRKSTNKDAFAGQRTGVLNLFPLFILGFLILAAVRSIGDAGINAGGRAFGLWDMAAWKDMYGVAEHWAANFLVVALSGVGLNTRLSTFKGLGLKPFIAGLATAIAVGGVSFIAISLMGAWVG